MLTWPVFWIVAALATILYYIEKSDFARSMPIGNVLRKRYDSHAELPMLHGKVAVVGASHCTRSNVVDKFYKSLSCLW
eukprot:m.478805 g.478805  ORF g.478805 m.478805 type:complete len:78 (-) comp21695_c1_seq8:3016-3249(-)